MTSIAKPIHLNGILDLWKENRSTLGLMPKDAFIDCIKKKWLYVSTDDNDNVIGYLQFRHTNKTQTISIVHLCISKTKRGQNVAKSLLDNLVKDYSDKVIGIKLNCRSDYHDAIKFWQKYNFQPRGKQNSRGSDRNVHLITWWYSFGKTDLFSSLYSTKIQAILDFNIISKLRDIQSQQNSYPEVEMLLSDWITNDVEFYRTAETLSEIFRDQNTDRKEKSRVFISNFQELSLNKTEINRIEADLKSIFKGESANDLSDRRQLAEAIISGITYFITLDDEILKKKELLDSKYSLKVYSPSAFFFEIDELQNSARYFPNKLSGDDYYIKHLSSKEFTNIDCFIDSEQENKRDFLNKIDNIVNNRGEIFVIQKQDELISLVGYTINDNELFLNFIRTKKHFLAHTIFIQNLSDIINIAAKNKLNFIKIDVCTIAEGYENVIEQFGFFKFENQYIKALYNGVINKNNLEGDLDFIYKVVPPLENLVRGFIKNDSNKVDDKWTHYFLEKKMWPLKIFSEDLPCFIIPIKPKYARELFDTKAAKQTLFGVSPRLIWNNENVYYRKVNPNIESYPARILWYASQDKNSTRQKSIVGTSYLDEIIIGPAKELFNKHKKYGIFDWKRNIVPLTEGNEYKTIKILRFSNSESFETPISYNKILGILNQFHQKHNNFVSPVRIKSEIFMEIYKQVKGLQ